MTIKILTGMNALDVAILSAGSMEDLFALSVLNDISITDDLEPGLLITTTNKKYEPSTIVLKRIGIEKELNVMPGQTLLDLSVQELGSMEKLFELAKLNNLPLTENLTAGQILKVAKSKEYEDIYRDFKKNGWKPASDKTLTNPDGTPLFEGIDYWAIENDFIVQ